MDFRRFQEMFFILIESNFYVSVYIFLVLAYKLLLFQYFLQHSLFRTEYCDLHCFMVP